MINRTDTLILMSDNRNLLDDIHNADYNTLTAVINYEYATKHDYDFLYLKPQLNGVDFYNCYSPTKNVRHPSWSKLLSTLKILKEYPQYKTIVYIDSDCIFYKYDTSISEYLNVSKNPDNLQLDINSDIFFMNNKPWNHDLPCAGFYIIKNNQRSHEFIKAWFNYNDDPRFDTIHPWEQAPLNASLFKNYTDIKIELIDDWMFREYDGQFLRHIGTEEFHNRITFFKSQINLRNLSTNFYEYVNNIIKNNTVEFTTD